MTMNLPESFITQMRSLLGEEQYEKFCKALAQPQPTSVRTNPYKPSVAPPEGNLVPWCGDGVYLDVRPSFTLDPLFHAGAYYVQEASSMFLDHVLRKFVVKPSVVLDLCAAPGGKSTLTLSAMPEGSLLVANEIVRQRSQILAENITKWGTPNTIVTNNCASDFQSIGQVFDLIICDAPCSGEGMFRKDAQAVEEWSVQNVDMCQQRQREILEDIWPCLKPGGILVYSTCTYNVKENEENALWAAEHFGAKFLNCDVPDSWGVTGNLLDDQEFPVYHFFPHKTSGEGFFACVLRKAEADDECCRPKRAKEQGRRNKDLPFPKELKSWIKDSGKYTFVASEQSYSAFPLHHAEFLSKALQALKVIHYGVRMAALKGKAIIPAHSLAMSVALNRDSFPSCDIDLDVALSYLRAEAITLPAGVPCGYILLTYKGMPLGFVKNIGNRANNLYPQEWRIRFAGK